MAEASIDAGSESPTPVRRGWFRAIALGSSSLLAMAISACYAGRFDACAAITVFPAWIWLAPGLCLASLGLRRRGNRAPLLVSAGWLAFLLAFAEEPRSLLRLLRSPERIGRGATIRVVSLNCNVGDRRAAAEVAGLHPDVVLLQESPGREAVEALAGEIFGAEAGVVSGVDASMIVRGRVSLADLPASLRAYFVQARARLTSGVEVEVFSVRLAPAVFRLDLWSPDCWREQAENRRRRREQLREIANRIASVPEGIPILLGGDFNAPQGDAIFRLLRPRLRDSFAEAGRGWGNTITNDLPFLRIDQIWASRELRAASVVARRTRNSDHRMVVCDLTIAPSGR